MAEGRTDGSFQPLSKSPDLEAHPECLLRAHDAGGVYLGVLHEFAHSIVRERG
jgi:hypothetical protein